LTRRSPYPVDCIPTFILIEIESKCFHSTNEIVCCTHCSVCRVLCFGQLLPPTNDLALCWVLGFYTQFAGIVAYCFINYLLENFICSWSPALSRCLPRFCWRRLKRNKLPRNRKVWQVIFD